MENKMRAQSTPDSDEDLFCIGYFPFLGGSVARSYSEDFGFQAKVSALPVAQGEIGVNPEN
jgi:hypothetical protein